MTRFRTTQWSLINAAADDRTALESLCALYQPAIIAWLRRSAVPEQDIEDVSQAFFAHIIESGMLDRADRARGRFRTFLIAALKNFRLNQLERSRARKRGGTAKPVPLQSNDVADAGPTPQAAFDREFALNLVRLAMERLREEAAAAGKTNLFDALRHLLLERPEKGELADLAETFAMRPNTLAVAVHRLRERFRALFREEVLRVVADETGFDQEMDQLRSVFHGDR